MSLETTAYLFAYFTGEDGPDDEAVRFAVSVGNDVLHWRELNGGRPVLRSTAGERGLRDPFLLRGSRGDGCYLLATDMSAWRNGWQRTQTHGSRHIEVWQSTDLVDWGEQRHLLVSPPTAGNSWAPEAVWDPDRRCYAVYWAANLYPDSDPDEPRDSESSYNRMLIATTDDFRTIGPATVWIDERQGPGDGTIDATVVRHEGWWYRSTVVEGPNHPRIDRSRDLFATLDQGTNPWLAPAANDNAGWRPVLGHLGAGASYPGARTGRRLTLDRSEGVVFVRVNRDDIRCSGGCIALVDQAPYYDGEGYVPLWAPSPAATEWEVVTERALPRSARHGSVLPITTAEYHQLLGAYAPQALVRCEPVAVSTGVGREPELPATVPAIVGPGTAQSREVPALPVRWPGARQQAWERPGVVELTGTTDGGGLVRATIRVAP